MKTMSFAVTAAMFEGALAVLAVCIGWWLSCPPLATYKFDWIDLGWGVLATLPPLVIFWLCTKTSWKPFARIMQVLDETIVPLFRQCAAIELAVIAFLAGLGEEMLFRGIVQAWLADKVGGAYGTAIGLAAAAVIFGLLHGITPTYALLAGIVGFYLGAIWLVSGNLIVPITSHALYDFMALVYLVHVRGGSAEAQTRDEPPEQPAE
jgi:uncharacterized protein